MPQIIAIFGDLKSAGAVVEIKGEILFAHNIHSGNNLAAVRGMPIEYFKTGFDAVNNRGWNILKIINHLVIGNHIRVAGASRGSFIVVTASGIKKKKKQD